MTTMKQSRRSTGVKMVQRLHTRKEMMMMKQDDHYGVDHDDDGDHDEMEEGCKNGLVPL